LIASSVLASAVGQDLTASVEDIAVGNIVSYTGVAKEEAERVDIKTAEGIDRGPAQDRGEVLGLLQEAIGGGNLLLSNVHEGARHPEGGEQHRGEQDELDVERDARAENGVAEASHSEIAAV